MDQLKKILDAAAEKLTDASSAAAEEAYEAYLASVLPSADELALQRAHPPLALPRFVIALAGPWDGAEAARSMASLEAQTYSRFDITLDPKHASGDYILYLWQGDTLSPDALYHFARAAGGGADLIYCDEHVHAPDKEPCSPFFKSAPNQITQMCYDMLSCGVAARMDLFHRTGGMTGYDPAARYAYNVQCLRASRRAVHIPRPLYALASDRRPDASAIRVLEPFLAPGETLAIGQWAGSFRVERMQRKAPSVAIIIPNQNNPQGLRRLLESLEAQTIHPYGQIIIADLGSKDSETLRYYDILEKNKAASIIHGDGLPLPKMLNQAAMETSADALVFLGPHTEIISAGWLDNLLGQLYRSGVAAAGGKLLDPRGRLLFAGGIAGIGGWAGSFYTGQQDRLWDLRQNRFTNSIRTVSILSLACLSLRSSIFWNVGGFDESFSPYGADMDLCLRLLRRGYACVYTPYALLRCYGPVSNLADGPEENRLRCYDALRTFLLWGDPHCSPNYDFNQALPVAAAPPRPAIEWNELYKG